MSDFNPQSPDAMFARVLQRLDSQDDTLARIEENTDAGFSKLKHRVEILERERWYQRGFTAALAAGVVAGWEWLKSHWNGH